MSNVRYATVDDAPLITSHRHRMFQDNAFAPEEVLARMDASFEPWVREGIADGRYVGLLWEENSTVVAGAGIFFGDFPPHWIDAQPLRAYVLNVYTAPDFRGQGYAKHLMLAVIEECKQRGVPTVVLHASPQGRPVYEKLGFFQTDEMMLRLPEATPGKVSSGHANIEDYTASISNEAS
jgi:GNAT superfamily N-acetyltransferase